MNIMEDRTRYPNPHDRHYEKAWRNCRAGYSRCVSSPDDMDTVRQHIKRFTDRGPHIYSKWLEILEGRHPEHAACLLDERYESYFDLPVGEQDFFFLVQSHPFAVLFAGERYEELKRRRAEKEYGY